jgi:hypothetical protein
MCPDQLRASPLWRVLPHLKAVGICARAHSNAADPPIFWATSPSWRQRSSSRYAFSCQKKNSIPQQELKRYSGATGAPSWIAASSLIARSWPTDGHPRDHHRDHPRNRHGRRIHPRRSRGRRSWDYCAERKTWACVEARGSFVKVILAETFPESLVRSPA